MKKSSKILLCLQAAGSLFLLNACNNQPSANTAPPMDAPNPNVYSIARLPQDVLPTCTVPADTLQTWFESGKITENGAVTPANSVTFGHENNCDFYQWAQRMFLWVTSPAPQGYGGGSTVLASNVFFTVAPDSLGELHLVGHQPGAAIQAVSALRKDGPNRLPVFTDKHGRLFEVQFHKPGEKVLIKNAAGQVLELGAVQKTANGPVTLKDKTGKPVEKPHFFADLVHPERVLQAFQTESGIVFLDNDGNEVDTGVDQATQDVLMAGNGSLVYYITMVNDMYAYFLTAVKNKKMSGTTFPTTAATRDSILAFAAAMRYEKPADPNALAIEIKSSWVPVDSLINAADYVTIDAVVPTYDTSSPTRWVPNGQKTIKLALVGIHIVGSVAGHPEMVWATFEHRSNTPDTAYQYLNTAGQVQTVASDSGKWLFSSAAGAPFNASHMKVSPIRDTILARPGYNISPSNTQREAPFGVAFNGIPNQQDSSAAASNSELIGVNNSIINQLAGVDRRKKYFFIGATWTFGGTAPNGNVYPVDTTAGTAIGTSILANSTMETYFQSVTTSCFFCHSKKNSLQPSALSHIFGKLYPIQHNLK